MAGLQATSRSVHSGKAADDELQRSRSAIKHLKGETMNEEFKQIAADMSAGGDDHIAEAVRKASPSLATNDVEEIAKAIHDNFDLSIQVRLALEKFVDVADKAMTDKTMLADKLLQSLFLKEWQSLREAMGRQMTAAMKMFMDTQYDLESAWANDDSPLPDVPPMSPGESEIDYQQRIIPLEMGTVQGSDQGTVRDVRPIEVCLACGAALVRGSDVCQVCGNEQFLTSKTGSLDWLAQRNKRGGSG